MATYLSDTVRLRRPFDPTREEDIEEYRYFLKHAKWKNGCPFRLDWPYLTVPDMIKDRTVKNILKV